MKFSCHRCKTRYSIGDEKVRGKILKVRCKKCSELIVVRERSVHRTRTAAERGMLERHLASAEPTRQPSPAPAAPPAQEPAQSPPPGPAAPAQPAGMPMPPPAPPAAESDWSVALDGRVDGPWPTSELKRRIREGEVARRSHVWREGDANWQPLGDVAELAAEFPSHPEPPAPPPAPPAAPEPPATQPPQSLEPPGSAPPGLQVEAPSLAAKLGLAPAQPPVGSTIPFMGAVESEEAAPEPAPEAAEAPPTEADGAAPAVDEDAEKPASGEDAEDVATSDDESPAAAAAPPDEVAAPPDSPKLDDEPEGNWAEEAARAVAAVTPKVLATEAPSGSLPSLATLTQPPDGEAPAITDGPVVAPEMLGGGLAAPLGIGSDAPTTPELPASAPELASAPETVPSVPASSPELASAAPTVPTLPASSPDHPVAQVDPPPPAERRSSRKLLYIAAALLLLLVAAGALGSALRGKAPEDADKPALVAAHGDPKPSIEQEDPAKEDPGADPAGDDDGDDEPVEITFDAEALWDEGKPEKRKRRRKTKEAAPSEKSTERPAEKPQKKASVEPVDGEAGRVASIAVRPRSTKGLGVSGGSKLKGLSALDRLDAARGGKGGFDRSRLGKLGSEASKAHLPKSLSPDQIKDVINRHRKGLKSCLDRHLKREGGGMESKKVMISFKIRGSGRPARIRLSDGMSDSVFGICVRAQLANWTFPRHRGEAVPVKYPVILTATH